MMLRAFHCNWTKPFTVRSPQKEYCIEPFELFTTALSALLWRKENGSIYMICDSTAQKYYETNGLAFLWDGGIYPLLDDIPEEINPTPFWAAGKLYALTAMRAPCVMIDTDFIVWRSLRPILYQADTAPFDVAAIHQEDIMPDIYPGPEAFTQTKGFPFYDFDWTIPPLNTALSYFGNDAFRQYYTNVAIRFMRCSQTADDVLTYMVFAEQRLLAMCAAKQRRKLYRFSNLESLFNGEQQGYFTHIWGFKQQMRDTPALYEDFCIRCARRLQRDFSAEARLLAANPVLSSFF